MNPRRFSCALTLLVVGIHGAAPLAAAPARKPNVVYLPADDLGWGGLSRNGGKISTPAIDRPVTLSPFVIRVDTDAGAAPTDIRSGARLETPAKNVPSAISTIPAFHF